MMRAAIGMICLMLAGCAPAPLDDAQLSVVGAKPPAGARLPGDIRFKDEAGRSVPARELWADGKPVLLAFVDYRCRYLCGVGLPMLTHALDQAGLEAERDFTLAALPLDPQQGPPDAILFRKQRLETTGAGGAIGLFTGDQPSISAAASALGYRYRLDAASGRYAHAAATYVLAPGGRAVAVLGQFGLRADALRAALADARDARDTKRAGLAAGIASLCYSLLPTHGRWSGTVILALQILALGSLAAVLVGFLWLRRRRST
jgi:protein SCO1/2